MLEIHDKIFLFVCSIILYMLEVQEIYMIIPIILALIITCLSTYSDDRRIKLAYYLIYIALCLLIPDSFIFLPLVIYDIALYDYQILAFLIVAPLFRNFHELNLSIITFTLVFSMLAWFLKNRTTAAIRLLSEYNELRDTTKELAILQEQKNQSLLENQDYEVNLATLNERNRISKEIHDNIGHLLSRSLIQIGALLTITKEEITKEGLASLKESLSEGMDSIRNSIHNMHNESIDLYTSIDTIIKEFTFCNISFEYDIKSNPELKLKYSILAIIKEALSNIMKHSNATKVVVSVREHPALYQLIISDNGTMDFLMKEKLSKLIENQLYMDGIGLQNITDRVKNFNGNINFNLEDGFRIFITIPK
ncbi:MAG: two-component sensor histidine kinase [Anaerocolumna sp.]|nr:two-component sensor histidine kinase [Anaerocolumna sp.]